MKKSTTTTLRLSSFAILTLAFLAGMLVYFLGAIGVDKLTPAAGAVSGGWQQVTVVVASNCDCITIFRPQPSLAGSGAPSDPFISNNTEVDMLVGVSGVGHITIEDENGDILAEFDQNFGDPPDRIVHITFPDAGGHKLIIKCDGAEVAANGVSTELYFNIGHLQPIVPDFTLPGAPKTGLYIYIAGYAVQVYSLLISGAIGAVAAWFILAAHRRRQQREKTQVRVFIKKPRPKRRSKKPPTRR
jgi:hypothetical protein